MALLEVPEVFDDLFTSEITIRHVSGQVGDDGELEESAGEAKTVKAIVTSDQKALERLP